MGSEDKIIHFRWIENLIAINKVETPWVVGCPGVVSQDIKKHSLNFKAKS